MGCWEDFDIEFRQKWLRVCCGYGIHQEVVYLRGVTPVMYCALKLKTKVQSGWVWVRALPMKKLLSSSSQSLSLHPLQDPFTLEKLRAHRLRGWRKELSHSWGASTLHLRELSFLLGLQQCLDGTFTGNIYDKLSLNIYKFGGQNPNLPCGAPIMWGPSQWVW